MIDLSKYRVEREEGAERGDPFGDIVPGRYGHIYRHGLATLGVATTGRRLVPKLRRLATLVQDGSDGANLVFAADKLAAVARLIGARRKRRLSADHAAKLAAGKAERGIVRAVGASANASEHVESTADTLAA
jgi:hypothetical protein